MPYVPVGSETGLNSHLINYVVTCEFSSVIYLLLVKTNGVAVLEPLRRVNDCSFPSLDVSPPAPLPENGQIPLALDPLPPILRDKA